MWNIAGRFFPKFLAIRKFKKCPVRPGLCGSEVWDREKSWNSDSKEKWPYRPLKSYNVDRIILCLLGKWILSEKYLNKKIFHSKKIIVYKSHQKYPGAGSGCRVRDQFEIVLVNRDNKSPRPPAWAHPTLVLLLKLYTTTIQLSQISGIYF